jgi:hypothetical protein
MTSWRTGLRLHLPPPASGNGRHSRALPSQWKNPPNVLELLKAITDIPDRTS